MKIPELAAVLAAFFLAATTDVFAQMLTPEGIKPHGDSSPVASPTPAAKNPAPSLEITAATSPAPLRIKLEAAAEREGKAETAFRSNVENIFVRWHGENLAVGSVVRLAWVAEDVGDLVEPDFIVDQTETTVPTAIFGARFTLSRPTDGWAPGKYRVDLFLDGVFKDTLGITIRD
ncbi:MAG: hypothetical protein M3Y86_11880 [Verrucomicrobiota bacterium]|nr:hypothetical protein [Verrucomicrobiota bacterium]